MPSTLNAFVSPKITEQTLLDATGADVPEYGYMSEDVNFMLFEKIFYQSEGKTLDATMTVYGPFDYSTKHVVSYGMLIDSDADYKTGIWGYDYRYKVTWENNSWHEYYEKLPSYQLTPVVISNQTIQNIFNNSERNIKLSLDLGKIGSPEYYNIIFYTEALRDSEPYKVQDFASLAIIPPPKFSVETIPSPIKLDSGITDVVYLKVKSEMRGNPEIFFDINTDSKDIQVKSIIGNSVFLQDGVAEIPMEVSIPAHDKVLYHNLNLSIDPWYPLNPNRDNPTINDDLIKNSFYRNNSERAIFKINLVSGISKFPISVEVGVQITIALATIALAIVAIRDLKRSKDIVENERKQKHSQDILGVYDLLLDSVFRKNYHEKTLVLQAPQDEKDRNLLRLGMILDTHELDRIPYIDLNTKNVDYLDWAIQHLTDKYSKAGKKWNEAMDCQKNYENLAVKTTQKILEKSIQEMQKQFPNFIEYDGYTSNPSYFGTNIARTIFDIIEQMKEYDEPPNTSVQYVPYEDEGVHSIVKDGLTLFQSKNLQDLDESKIQNVLGCCFTDKEILDYFNQMNELHKKSNNILREFKTELKVIIKMLKGGDLIKGKCQLKY